MFKQPGNFSFEESEVSSLPSNSLSFSGSYSLVEDPTLGGRKVNQCTLLSPMKKSWPSVLRYSLLDNVQLLPHSRYMIYAALLAQYLINLTKETYDLFKMLVI